MYVENVPSFAVRDQIPGVEQGSGWVGDPRPDGTYTSAVSLLNGVVEQVSPKDALFTHEYSTKHFVPAQVIIDAKGQFQAGSCRGTGRICCPHRRRRQIYRIPGVSLLSDGSGTLQCVQTGEEDAFVDGEHGRLRDSQPQKTAIVGAVKVTDGKITGGGRFRAGEQAVAGR